MPDPLSREESLIQTEGRTARPARPYIRHDEREEEHPDRHRHLRRASSMALTILTVWFAGFIAFVCTIWSIPAPPDDLHTDGIVVLTGGANRVNTGLDLLKAGKAERLLISGVHDRVSEEKLVSLWKGGNEAPCCITLGHEAHNTAGNAQETAAWAAKQNMRTVRLVTSGYHMPRAWLELHYAMPDVILVPHPVRPGATETEQKNFWLLAFPEYNKTILIAAQHYLLHDFRKNAAP